MMGEDSFFFSSPFDFNNSFQGSSYVLFEDSSHKDKAVYKGSKHSNLFSIEEFGEFNPHSTHQASFYQDNIIKKVDQTRNHHRQQQQQPGSNYSMFDEFQFDDIFIPTHPNQEPVKLVEIPSKLNKKAFLHPTSSLELLRNSGNRFKTITSKTNGSVSDQAEDENNGRLSTEEIMRVAGETYIQFFSRGWDDLSYTHTHPFGFELSGLSEPETRDVELAHILLSAAEKVGQQQYDRAMKLLHHCEWMASSKANPVQKVVYYFSEALRDRIERETGRIAFESKELNEIFQGLSIHPVFLTFHQKFPFNQTMQLAGIQIIVEHAATERKIHLIDLEIRSGVQWTALMQALAERRELPVEHLKITAVGFTGNRYIEESGTRLVSVAESFNLPFSFKAIYVIDMINTKKEQFDIEDDEMVAIYSPFILRTMISKPNRLENLMRLIQNLNPSIMVVVEVEANHNSPSFVNRFVESLFFYSAFFDCIDTYMQPNDEYRTMVEAILWEGIRNVVATEGTERVTRNVKMEVWRAFFARFGMVELELSESSLYQAELVVKGFAGGNSCTLEMIGKCLTVGWKGTPFYSLSAWSFCGQ